mmetsp:Transcript_43648/g.69287  ORF Transcript_43648/g.69287 Transcript_43648/m.69287 type:complete len:198 (+) Transcript_43648:61-654(+)
MQRLKSGSRIFTMEDEEPESEFGQKMLRTTSTESLVDSSEIGSSCLSRGDSKTSCKSRSRQLDAMSEASTSTGSDPVRPLLRPKPIRRSSTYNHRDYSSSNILENSEGAIRPSKPDGLPTGRGGFRKSVTLALCELEMLGHDPVLEASEIPQLPGLNEREEPKTCGYGCGLAPTKHPRGRLTKESRLPALRGLERDP